MSILHTEAVDRLLELTAPESDAVREEMEARADRERFPTVGPEVGAFLRLCVRMRGVSSAIEFGSGFGYSAYWMAPAIGSDGRIVLTEFDADELEQARDYFERGGLEDRATFEHGDALEIVERYDGPFDLVLLDHETSRYVEGFEAVRGKLSENAVVIADNVLHTGAVRPDDLVDALEGESRVSESERSTSNHPSLEGAVAYLEHVRSDPDFETAVVPIGDGLVVSVRL